MRAPLTRRIARNERGIALAMVILALVVVGALVAAAVYMGLQEERLGTGVRRFQKSSALAEAGAYEMLRTWNAQTLNAMQPTPGGATSVASTTTANGTGSYAGSIQKLTSKLYLIDATGTDNASAGSGRAAQSARQRAALLVRVVPLQIDVRAAMTVGDSVRFGGGNVFVDGSDHAPPGWPSCGPLDTALAGVRAASLGDVTSSAGQVAGNPPVLATPTMDTSTFFKYGPTSYAQLAAGSTITLPAGTYAPAPTLNGALCDTLSTNWGDGANPAAPCGTRVPIVHITGNASITGGQGQGVLLVDGDLTLGGTFTFYGLIVVRGAMVTTLGGSPTIYGSLFTASMDFATTAFNGDATINYSRCALQRVFDATGNPAPLRSRGYFRPT
ncbi:MAG: hypothetical protein NVS1B4_24800 [Gemmatimonadaceae bacterium]